MWVGVPGGLNIGVYIKWSKKTNGIQRPSLGPPWPSKSLQIDGEPYCRVLCEVPAHYTPLQQSHGHLMVPSSTRTFDRVRRKLLQKPDLPVLKEIQSGK